jgi:hypothetical protein
LFGPAKKLKFEEIKSKAADWKELIFFKTATIWSNSFGKDKKKKFQLKVSIGRQLGQRGEIGSQNLFHVFHLLRLLLSSNNEWWLTFHKRLQLPPTET